MAKKCLSMGCVGDMYPCKNDLSPFYTRLVAVYSCRFHVIYLCCLCRQIVGIWLERDISTNQIRLIAMINHHYIEKHSFDRSRGNYSFQQQSGIMLANKTYRDILYGFGRNTSKISHYCYLDNILLNYPHFICLRPEFSFSKLMNRFDDDYAINEFDLFALILNKTFSCVICGGVFESFPSCELYMAHKCDFIRFQLVI